MRRRLDVELVRRQIFASRQGAQSAISDKQVLVSGVVADKAARLVDVSEPITVRHKQAGEGIRFVSRGGHKLAAALDRFAIDCTGKRVIDAGSSTGGFCDCLLSRQAGQVVCIDVGRNQLHEKLRGNPRVTLYEQTNIRYVQPNDVGGTADMLVVDLSFISLRTVAAALARLVCESSHLLLLVKPQFEAGRIEASKGRGVIRDPAIWQRTLGEVGMALVEHNVAVCGAMPSPLVGGDGNVEFFFHAVKHTGAPLPFDLDVVDVAVCEARQLL